MSQSDWINTAIYSGIFLSLFAVAELLYHKVKLPAEITRKFVHMGSGVVCLTFPFFLSSHWAVLILTSSFVVILFGSIKLNMLKSINAVERKTGGSYIFALVIYLNFWVYSVFGLHDMDAEGLVWESAHVGNNLFYGATVYFFLPILILTVSDPMAALIGKKWPVGKFKVFGHCKTIMGSSAFFFSAMAISMIFMLPLATTLSNGILIAACIALGTTFVEAITHRGLDNLFIPLVTVIIMVAFQSLLQV